MKDVIQVDAQSRVGMDTPRKRQRRLGRVWIIAAVCVALLLVSSKALPPIIAQNTGLVVDRAGLITDTARIRTIQRTVDSQGTFIPEHVRIAAATQPGVVDRINVKPGSYVSRGTVIAQLQNPALHAAVLNAVSSVDVARANLADTMQRSLASIVERQSALNDARALNATDALQVRTYKALLEKGLVPYLTYQQAFIEEQKSVNDVSSKSAELRLEKSDADAKLASSRAQLQRARADLEQARSQENGLTVRAAADGLVQTVDVDPGASVPQNTAIAKIADQHDLKVVIPVAESDAHAIVPFMQVKIDTGNGQLNGFVSRIAPSARNGTVAVDVAIHNGDTLNERLDATVNGRIIISQIRNALSITRPVGASDLTTVELYKLIDGGARALRVRVQLGRGTTDRVAVLSGLAEGDTVIVSDMSNYIDHAQLRLR
jgi:multidrug efflux pump subunit AcrA (membrane-fusion protein)